MKKRNVKVGLLCVLLIATMIFMFGCTDNTGDDPNSSGESESSLSFTPETYPKFDGATAAIPLSEHIAAKLMNLSLEEARQYVNHTTTHNAYLNLIDENVDFILANIPSEEEQQLIDEKGDDFVITQIRNEGFVFLNHKDNPVDSLTIDELRGIYSGEITNWNEVGGNDEEIIAFQRPENSGSQTGIQAFVMGDTPLMSPPTEWIAAAMDDLIEVVASFSGETNGIGYSYYYYVSNMHLNENVKMLKIEGIYPDNDTIGAGEYPLTTGSYIIHLKSRENDTLMTDMIEWILSDEGQSVVGEAGYVPLKEV